MPRRYRAMPALADAQILRFWESVDVAVGCWLWRGSYFHEAQRRPRFMVGDGPGRSRTLLAARVAYFLAYGVDPDGSCVLHSCDNPSCCRPSHLFLGTQTENMVDRDRKGRHARRLSDGQVHAIRRLCDEGTRPTELAALFKIHPTYAAEIGRRAAWRHLPETADAAA